MSIPNTNEITAYIHCGKCFNDKVPHKLATGWTEIGLQIWCENCESNVAHIDFGGQTHAANTTRQRE